MRACTHQSGTRQQEDGQGFIHRCIEAVAAMHCNKFTFTRAHPMRCKRKTRRESFVRNDCARGAFIV